MTALEASLDGAKQGEAHATATVASLKEALSGLEKQLAASNLEAESLKQHHQMTVEDVAKEKADTIQNLQGGDNEMIQALISKNETPPIWALPTCFATSRHEYHPHDFTLRNPLHLKAN